jgi:hypothetical protein
VSNRPLAVAWVAALCAVAACAAGCGSAPRSAAASSRPAVYGPSVPPSPDAACADAVRAERALRVSQDKDRSDPSALGADFTAFASRLGADAQKETDPAAARAMTRLANDYTSLVESGTGGAELPAMSTVEHDGTAFGRACQETP